MKTREADGLEFLLGESELPLLTDVIQEYVAKLEYAAITPVSQDKSPAMPVNQYTGD